MGREDQSGGRGRFDYVLAWRKVSDRLWVYQFGRQWEKEMENARLREQMADLKWGLMAFHFFGFTRLYRG